MYLYSNQINFTKNVNNNKLKYEIIYKVLFQSISN